MICGSYDGENEIDAIPESGREKGATEEGFDHPRCYRDDESWNRETDVATENFLHRSRYIRGEE